METGAELQSAVCAFAGLRVSEALALRWQDVDFDAGLLNVRGTKTAASRQPVPMTADLAAELRAHRTRRPGLSEALVFSTAEREGAETACRRQRRAGRRARR